MSAKWPEGFNAGNAWVLRSHYVSLRKPTSTSRQPETLQKLMKLFHVNSLRELYTLLRWPVNFHTGKLECSWWRILLLIKEVYASKNPGHHKKTELLFLVLCDSRTFFTWWLNHSIIFPPVDRLSKYSSCQNTCT